MEATPDTAEKRINRNIQGNKRDRYSQELKEKVFGEIIERLYSGEALQPILQSNELYPSGYSFFKWLIDPTYANIYAYAREVKAHRIFDECLVIADNSEGNEDTIQQVQRDRLRLDARKFYLAKVLPKIYGEKVDITSGGEAINVVSLGIGLAPPEVATTLEETTYIDVTNE
jgi:hypothetical protein